VPRYDMSIMNTPGKIFSLSEILKQIPRNSRIFIGSGCAEPQELVRQLVESAPHFADAEILHILTAGRSEYVEPRYVDNFRHNAFFIGPNVRQAVTEGAADYTPIFLSELPGLFESRQLPIDLALIQVSPPDAHGYCSLGVSVDVVKSAAAVARIVVAQVNSQMPRTMGDSLLHISQFHYFLEFEEPIIEYKTTEPDAVTLQIARHVARLITDGSTLQLGIGAISEAVLKMLEDKNDLGVHTERFSDGLVPLIKKGVINNKQKGLHPGKSITSFVMGTRPLYDFVHNNPAVEFHPSQYTNNPFVISRNRRMVAINSALEVDLTGQVCADSIGHRFFSGIGGQVDFIRGAALSEGGKPVIALPSTADNGKFSRIVADLTHGAGVTTTRGDVHYVVTEYGIAYLYGKSIRQRALEMINIAHPDFRGELLDAMKKRHYVYPDQKLETIGRIYPEQYEITQNFKDTGPILFRPIKPTDERMLQDFFYSHNEDTIFLRYHGHVKTMHHTKAQDLVNVDYKQSMAIVGVVGEIGKERIIAVARYIAVPGLDFPEIAFVVHEAYRGKGIAGFLFQQLKRVAMSNGFEGFTAYVLPENTAMLRVFDRNGAIERRFEDGVFKLKIRFKQ
jgi:acyl-CoA hydrolase/ribosomal protein S18 acetylase RimI-like enzyme